MKLKKVSGEKGIGKIELIVILSMVAFLVLLLMRPRELTIDKTVSLYLLPNTPTSLAPIPKFLEKHLGGDWVFCRGQINWMTVIYYPKDIDIQSIHLVPNLGEDISGPVSYEITACGAEPNDQAGIFHRKWIISTEVFRTTPLPDQNPIFIKAPKEVVSELSRKIK